MKEFVHIMVLGLTLLINDVNSQNGDLCSYISPLKRSDCTPVTDLKFTTIPNDLPSDVEIIVMTGNQISMLYSGNLTYYKNLTELHLHNNIITTLPAGLTSTVSTIQKLYLDGNPLTNIEDNAFQHLNNLKLLSLKNTNLVTLRSDMFSGLTSLEELYFDQSQLSNIPNNLFSNILQVRNVSIINTNLQTLPDDPFGSLDLSNVVMYLANNPWSCDCDLQDFYSVLTANPNFPADRDNLYCQWPSTGLIASTPFGKFVCTAPIIETHPQNASILSDRSYTLVCDITGAPFPDVTWLKDDVPITYTDRVHLQLYDASLHFTVTELEDAGIYQCLVENKEGNDNSSRAILEIKESTCFDHLLSSHETDIDCGGIYCITCNQTQSCKVDTDCNGELVCLYSHPLPSLLHYISPTHVMAYTCELPQLPRDLLNSRIQDTFSSNIFMTNFTVDNDLNLVQDAMKDMLAEQLSISVSAITDVRVTTIERTSPQSTPLVQIWFNLSKTPQGIEGHTSLIDQVNSGKVKGTVKIIEYNSYYSVRVNL